MDAEDVDGTDFDKTFIEEPAILDKYKAAADVCEKALTLAIESCIEGADIYEVCQKVDEYTEEEL
jgi:methionine aminopeptidase